MLRVLFIGVLDDLKDGFYDFILFGVVDVGREVTSVFYIGQALLEGFR